MLTALSGNDSGTVPFRPDAALLTQVKTARFTQPIRATFRSPEKEPVMLKFIGGTFGAIFLIGLLVVVGLLMLIF